MDVRTVTKDELWLEVKKAIDGDNFTKFKTKRGFEGFINRLTKKHPGKEFSFLFAKDYHVIEKCVLKLNEKK